MADGSNREILRTPLFPTKTASVNAEVPIPLGLTTPMPVITQRRFMCPRLELLSRAFRFVSGRDRSGSTYDNRPIALAVANPVNFLSRPRRRVESRMLLNTRAIKEFQVGVTMRDGSSEKE